MRKLLQINATSNWGSTGKIAEGIGQAAMSRGWESAIAYGRYSNPSSSLSIKVGSNKDVYLHYLRNRFFDQEGLGSKSATRELISWIERYNPDIIHLHNIHDHWLNYPILFNYLATIDTPIFWTFHDCWAFTGGCYHFENIGCQKWMKESCKGRCPLQHRSAESNFAKRLESYSSIGERLTIVAVSQWLADYVSQSVFSKIGANVRVINNGIDVNGVFKPYGAKEKLVLGVSNVWPGYKGLHDFIKLRNILPDAVQIVLVGLNKKQIEALPSEIIGISRTSNVDELAVLYRKASVFVNPTYNDSFPTVNLEALACGTPVITYRTGGSPEAIDGNTGMVVEKGDIEGLASAIQSMLDNPDKYSAEACRKRAVEHFNKDIQFGRYIDLYEEILSKSR